jgi:hypothetical protein
MENLGPAAGQAPQAGVDHVPEHPANGLFREPGKPVDLDWRPGLQVQVREVLVERADDAAVPLVFGLMVEPADDVELSAAVVDRLLSPLADLLLVHEVALRRAEIGAERAERATVDADVRGVEVGVDIVVGGVAVLPLADEIGQFAHLGQRGVVAVERKAVFERQPLAGFDLFADGTQEF